MLSSISRLSKGKTHLFISLDVWLVFFYSKEARNNMRTGVQHVKEIGCAHLDLCIFTKQTTFVIDVVVGLFVSMKDQKGVFRQPYIKIIIVKEQKSNLLTDFYSL